MPEAQSSYYSQLFTEGLKGLENETLGPKNGLLWRLLPWEARMGRVLLLSDSWSGKKIGVSGPAAAIQAGGGGGEGVRRKRVLSKKRADDKNVILF